jgi:hypothetical protein
MQVHRDLFIQGEPDKLQAVAEDISRSLIGSWSRDTQAEEDMTASSAGGPEMVFCFASPRHPRRPAATVFLLSRDWATLSVANIVPHQARELSRDQYNAIIEDFFSRYAEPAAARNGARAELTDANADLERWLPPQAAQKLRRFCTVANKRTSSSHPMDRARWYDFLVAAQEGELDFSASMLARWLMEEGGWDEELADKLAAEYELARGLLAFLAGQTIGA